jgi:hypothetical protein
MRRSVTDSCSTRRQAACRKIAFRYAQGGGWVAAYQCPACVQRCVEAQSGWQVIAHHDVVGRDAALVEHRDGEAHCVARLYKCFLSGRQDFHHGKVKDVGDDRSRIVIVFIATGQAVAVNIVVLQVQVVVRVGIRRGVNVRLWIAILVRCGVALISAKFVSVVFGGSGLSRMTLNTTDADWPVNNPPAGNCPPATVSVVRGRPPTNCQVGFKSAVEEHRVRQVVGHLDVVGRYHTLVHHCNGEADGIARINIYRLAHRELLVHARSKNCVMISAASWSSSSPPARPLPSM